MGKKASGQEFIEHDSHLTDHIAENFNNPEVSDVTLTVGDEVFAAHRLILATQSKVFHRMLLSKNWKESVEKKVTLEESPKGMAAFSDFLKFFYTGKLTLTIDNVCGIHTLADKYDVSVLKDDSLNFMKDVLTGVHGDALKAGLEWLHYVESFVPDMVQDCYSAIRTNFLGVCYTGTATCKHAAAKGLSFPQLVRLFEIADIKDDLVLFNETNVLRLFNLTEEKWIKLLPLVRFYNMTSDELEKVPAIPILKEYCSQAYKIHAERSYIVSKSNKKRRLSDGTADVLGCSCSEHMVCHHINPRFYIKPPYSKSTVKAGRVLAVDTIDLEDKVAFSHKMQYQRLGTDQTDWTIDMEGEDSGDAISEEYTIKPAASHVGRKFTLAIVAGHKLPCNSLHPSEKLWRQDYAIKYTGTVTATYVATSIKLNSPLRFQDSWKMGDRSYYGASVILHKR